ncbi:TPA: hypothetical protein ACHTCR_000223 [Pseudomonas putida]|uniref:Uncharacterized protein n=1 Tax=Pseudomonas putida TaxID=303 RepID=A0A1L5PLC7_PSEPU|nr:MULTISPECIES: hypothetical protein [Pseudomonas]APO80963.1 hypothetical protein BL240_05520 [Pseudomonas putida]MBH3384217.1 hypothetical protein [Pseudomonas juntendi]MCO7630276.1 hypothetical protein [Pseudomonas guariconensis]MDD2056238.1 hypothetical protein [Pseudomonas putida]PYC04402.1 hypothetical protein DMX12_09220 [Pseudomonas sp. MB-090624]
MFKTYRHAELSPASIFGEPSTRHWQFIELELHHPWFYVELVRDHGDDIVGSMLMIPTVPILQQMLSELDDHSWFAQAHLMSPGHMRGGDDWVMEPLIEVSVTEDGSGCIGGYLYKVEGGKSYSIHYASSRENVKVKEIIFSAERDLRVRG